MLAIKAHDVVHLIATRGHPPQPQTHLARGCAAGIAGTCECWVQCHPVYTGWVPAAHSAMFGMVSSCVAQFCCLLITFTIELQYCVTRQNCRNILHRNYVEIYVSQPGGTLEDQKKDSLYRTPSVPY